MSANSLAQTRVGWRKGRLDGRTSLLFRQALGRPWNPPTIEGLLRTTLRSLPPTNKSQPKRVRKPPKLLGLSSRERAVAFVSQAGLRWACGYPTTPFSLGAASPRTHASSRSLYCSRSGTQPTVFLRIARLSCSTSFKSGVVLLAGMPKKFRARSRTVLLWLYRAPNRSVSPQLASRAGESFSLTFSASDVKSSSHAIAAGS